MDSILITIKKLLGVEAEYKQFDTDIITFINNALFDLHQIGVGPEETPSISNELDTWENILGEMKDYKSVETYIYLKVKLVFDPPSSSSIIAYYEKQIEKLEWRLNIQTDIKKEV